MFGRRITLFRLLGIPIRLDVSWTYRTWPLTTWGWETGVPVPLWLGRKFDPQLGIRRIF